MICPRCGNLFINDDLILAEDVCESCRQEMYIEEVAQKIRNTIASYGITVDEFIEWYRRQNAPKHT